ncbi:SDR family oxidoreductase [Pelagibacteraceae bacterium]|nr:SDR family oxidoreductase [Pelagibacteraceae bacterium]
MKNFKGKVVIITGGGRGIGQEIASEFLKKKYFVYSLDKNFNSNQKSERNEKIKIDITNFNRIKTILKTIYKKRGSIDVLINCAGITTKLKKNNLLNYWNSTINNNLTSAFMISMFALPYLKKSNYPSIINITSITAKLGMSNNPAYNASKAGLKNLTYSLAMDFKEHKIRVNNICPGYIKTNMTKKSFNNKNFFKERVKRMMVKSYGSPRDIAKAAIFLASESSSYINASDLVVDGGFLRKGI